MDDKLNFSQQHELLDARHAQPVTVIGAGSVGSQVVSMLAKIGVPRIAVWDGDDIESHNIPMSAYGKSDVGRRKVDVLKALVESQSGLAIEAVPRMYAGEALKGAVVACVDTMEARRAVWDAVKLDPSVDILVDTRVAGEFLRVFAVRPSDPEDIDFYEKFLYPSNEAVRPTCGMHGIIYVGAAAAVAVCANLTSWWKKGRTRRHFQMLVVGLETITA